MEIRPACIEDISELLILVHSAYRGEGGWTSEVGILDGSRATFDMLKSTIEKTNSAILKYLNLEKFPDGRILGCVEVEKVEKKGEQQCHVGLLSVTPELQAEGIGKKLLFATHDWARENDCVALSLSVITVRDSLVAWYKRHGFIETGETEPFTSDPIYGNYCIPKQNLELSTYEKRL